MTPLGVEPPEEPSLLSRFAAAELLARTEEHEAREAEREAWMRAVLADHDRRRAHWHGRLLLWLLRKTT